MQLGGGKGVVLTNVRLLPKFCKIHHSRSVCGGGGVPWACSVQPKATSTSPLACLACGESSGRPSAVAHAASCAGSGAVPLMHGVSTATVDRVLDVTDCPSPLRFNAHVLEDDVRLATNCD